MLTFWIQVSLKKQRKNKAKPYTDSTQINQFQVCVNFDFFVPK